jgi:hypothetical protein
MYGPRRLRLSAVMPGIARRIRSDQAGRIAGPGILTGVAVEDTTCTVTYVDLSFSLPLSRFVCVSVCVIVSVCVSLREIETRH